MSDKKVYELSASSGLGLSVELAKLQEQRRKDKTGKFTPRKKFTKPLNKSVFNHVNKGLEDRARFDRPDRVVGSTLEEQEAIRASQASLAKKSQIYDRLTRDAPEFDEMDDNQLIDFERKKMDAPEPKKASKKFFFEDDPWVEYIDEFGRTRLMRQTEVRELQASDGEILSDDEMSGDVKREIEREEWERQREERSKGPIHYDAAQEHRTRGVGFYKFSNIEEERREQMEQLKKLREDTDRKRALQQSIQEKRNGQLQDRISKISLLHSSRDPRLLFPAPYFASGRKRPKGKRPTDIDISQFTRHVKNLLDEVKDSMDTGTS